MAEQITGAKIDVGPNVPLLDVDTAIVHLLEDLHRAGRTNEAHALGHLVRVARQVFDPWYVYDGYADPALKLPTHRQREIRSYDYENRVIVLEPMEEEDDDAPCD
jgi:hypothetical protein